jgi:tripartite-type tricarboxylate transporter receptor subunit TctC
MSSQMRLTVLALSVALAAFCSRGALAQDFPHRPIRLISPFPAGGGNDILSRIVAQAISKSINQTVVVDNRPGANTIVGVDIVAKAAPDGYTLVMASSSHTSNATLYQKLPYDPVRDFSPVSMVALTPYLVAVYPGFAASTIPELIALARAAPGQISYPSAGAGNPSHLAVELFAAMAGVRFLHVPYKGSNPGIVDLIAGRHSFVITTALTVVPYVKSGRLRALAVTTAARWVAMPELPTVDESGLPGYEASSWYGILAPAATPRNIVTRLHGEVVHALGAPAVKEFLAVQGIVPVGNTPAQFAAILQSDIIKWAKVIKATGARPE